MMEAPVKAPAAWAMSHFCGKAAGMILEGHLDDEAAGDGMPEFDGLTRSEVPEMLSQMRQHPGSAAS